MTETGILPDFITVDGGEGGTGAAPLEYTNSVGMPLREGLALVADCLTGFGLRNEIRLIATGKILTGFHLIKHLALGADIGCSARGMMLALGCVHSLTCNSNRCPSGVATQDPHLARGLVVEDKSKRVFHYHAKTIQATAELLSSAGLRHTAQLNRTHIHRRISPLEAMRYDQLFPYIKPGSLLTEETGQPFSLYLKESCSARFTLVASMCTR